MVLLILTSHNPSLLAMFALRTRRKSEFDEISADAIVRMVDIGIASVAVRGGTPDAGTNANRIVAAPPLTDRHASQSFPDASLRITTASIVVDRSMTPLLNDSDGFESCQAENERVIPPESGDKL